MTKVKLIIVLLTLSHQMMGQEFSSRMWHDGTLVTINRDTINGKLKYDMPTNSVQILDPETGKKVLTLSSKKIMYYAFFDQNYKHFRQFYSIPYQIRQDYKAPILFEILYEGKTSLLSREKIVVEVDPYQSFANAGGSSSVERLIHTYYFVDENGKIQFYSGKKNELFLILNKNQDTIKKYVKSNKLRVEEMNDLIRLIAFYNSL